MREGGAAATAWWVWVAVAWWMREGHCVGLSKGFWESGVLWHVRLILLEGIAEARQHRMLGVELTIPRYQHWGQHWRERKKNNQIATIDLTKFLKMGDRPPDGNMELLQTKCISILIFTLTMQLLENCETAVVTSNAGTLPRNFGISLTPGDFYY